MTTTDDIITAITADATAATILDAIAAFDTATNMIDCYIDDYRDELDDDAIALIHDNYDAIAFRIAARFLDILATN